MNRRKSNTVRGWIGPLALGLALVALGCGPRSGGLGQGNNNGNQNNNNTNNNGNLDASVSNDASGSGQQDAQADAGQAWQLDGAAATDACPSNMQNPCPSPIDPGCQGSEIANNGLDDNCNGQVDEGSICAPGQVQPCFLGPPGRANVGACVMGTQTCQGRHEFGIWGPCTGGIWPSAEICDDLDNDCNGCDDDGLCCSPPISCPAPSDILDAQPFVPYQLDGSQWYTGVANSWTWDVVGGPCDAVIGPQFTVTNGNGPTPTIDFTLSGDYTVTMTVDTPTGPLSCTFVVHVVGPGLRVELCWEGTGSRDLDLHLQRDDLASNWCDNANDCHYSNCAGWGWGMGSWGYTDTPLANCGNGPSGPDWTTRGSCANPRLDIDNIFTANIPENINVDEPNDAEQFRIMVHYYSGSGQPNPVVNIYCDGTRIATYGEAPNNLGNLFNNSSSGCQGNTWRVADVITNVNAGITTCTQTQLHPSGQSSGFDVRNNDASY